MSGDNIKDIRDRGRGGPASGIRCWEQFRTVYGVLGKNVCCIIFAKENNKICAWVYIFCLTRWCSLDHNNFRCDDLSWRERILCQLFWQRESGINTELKGINQTASKCDGTFVNSSQLQEILRTELSEDSLESSSGVLLGELSPMSSHRYENVTFHLKLKYHCAL